jgi:hypothetical protein
MTLRIRLAFALFALTVFAAACGGGGGGSSMVPSAGGSSGGTQGQNTTKMPIALYVPPANRQASSRRPFYISSQTQSFGVLAVPVTSTESPNPVNMQIFPVATPSPCAVASGGGYECTLTVVAPVGNDIFYIGAFATASPNANAVPLSEFETGQIDVGGTPNPSATPLSFTLNGVVYRVVVSVPSPDPGNSPNTQVFPAGTPSASWPLGITAYDSSGNAIASDPTNVFADPIVLTVSPSDGAVGLVLNSQCGSNNSSSARRRMTSFSGGSSSVSIACAADLNNVQFGYTGLTTPDPNDHVVDAFTISTTTQMVSPAPSPANVALASNVLSWQLGPIDNEVYDGQLQRNTSGALVYIATDGDGGNYVGTFDPSTQTVQNSGTFNNVNYPGMFALDSSGTFWLADTGNGVLDCWPSVASAVSGAAATVSGITPFTPGGDEIYVTAVAVDAAQNIWYVGYDSGGCEDCGARHRYQSESIPATDTGYSYAGYIPATACSSDSVNTSPTATAFLTNDYYDDYPFVAPLNSGSGDGIFVNSNTGVGTYVVTTSSSNVNQVTSQLAAGDGIGEGAAVDGAGTAFAAFYSSATADIESMPTSGSAFNTLLGLPPTTTGSYPGPGVWGIDAFSPSGGAADRIDYADDSYQALGLVESVPASPMPLLASVPIADYALSATHSAKGGEYMLYLDSSGNLDLARVIPTTTWSVPNAQAGALACNNSYYLLSIVERGNSAPFTVSYSPAPDVTSQPLPGTSHNYYLETSANFTFNVTVSDNGGRTETYPITTSQYSPEQCGAAHRPLHRGPRTRAIHHPVR